MQTEATEMDGAAATDVHTLVLMYEEAIRSMGRAAFSIEEGDIHGRCRHVERAITIVADLYAGLDMERAGDIARQLAVAYRLVLARLVLVNGRNDAVLARGAARLLKPILDAWRRIELDTAGPGRTEAAPALVATGAPALTAQAITAQAITAPQAVTARAAPSHA